MTPFSAQLHTGQLDHKQGPIWSMLSAPYNSTVLPATALLQETQGMQCLPCEPEHLSDTVVSDSFSWLLLQTCTKQGGMPAGVLPEARRHAERLIELDPENPASHEMMSYVLMHDSHRPLEEACK